MSNTAQNVAADANLRLISYEDDSTTIGDVGKMLPPHSPNLTLDPAKFIVCSC
jgi:hypothetical protein